MFLWFHVVKTIILLTFQSSLGARPGKFAVNNLVISCHTFIFCVIISLSYDLLSKIGISFCVSFIIFLLLLVCFRCHICLFTSRLGAFHLFPTLPCPFLEHLRCFRGPEHCFVKTRWIIVLAIGIVIVVRHCLARQCFGS